MERIVDRVLAKDFANLKGDLQKVVAKKIHDRIVAKQNEFRGTGAFAKQ